MDVLILMSDLDRPMDLGFLGTRAWQKHTKLNIIYIKVKSSVLANDLTHTCSVQQLTQDSNVTDIYCSTVMTYDGNIMVTLASSSDLSWMYGLILSRNVKSCKKHLNVYNSSSINL